MSYENLVEELKEAGVQFDRGLSKEELFKIEIVYDLKFPRSLIEFYGAALPVAGGFYNWRGFHKTNVDKIQRMLNWPLDGVLFDAENNLFWRNEWGEKPPSPQEMRKKCAEKMRDVPRLIPVYDHFYLPVLADTDDPPVLSVYLTEIVYAGRNLDDFLRRQFRLIDGGFDRNNFIEIPFWTEL